MKKGAKTWVSVTVGERGDGGPVLKHLWNIRPIYFALMIWFWYILLFCSILKNKGCDVATGMRFPPVSSTCIARRWNYIIA